MLGLVTDPFQPFKDDAKYSPCPFLIVNMNLEPQLRYILGVGCHMVAISRGVTDDDVSKDPYNGVLDIITDELDWLERVGFDTSDAHTGDDHVHLFAKVTLHEACQYLDLATYNSLMWIVSTGHLLPLGPKGHPEVFEDRRHTSRVWLPQVLVAE
jgi:hypothetical protein